MRQGRLDETTQALPVAQADVFVLPTLAEGCASVVHEAVMAGCPVITTHASGTLVQQNRGGLIVPERNPEALAGAIAEIVENRDRRDELAESCGPLAEELSEDRWSERLMAALTDPSPKKIPADVKQLKA